MDAVNGTECFSVSSSITIFFENVGHTQECAYQYDFLAMSLTKIYICMI